MVPFAHYTPTARGESSSPLTPHLPSPPPRRLKLTQVTEHFAPHTVSYTPPTPATSVYPQHTQAFQALEQPQTPQDWQMRQAAEARIFAALQNGGSYGNL
jgi:hypothetical protein